MARAVFGLLNWLGSSMTFLLGKQCTDGILFLADGISIAQEPGSPAAVTTGAVKALCGENSRRPYCMVFGGHAGLDTTRPTIDWLRDAASKPDGNLQDNVEQAARDSLRDAVKNGFGKGDEQQQNELMLHGSILVFLSVRPDQWWSINAFHDFSDKKPILRSGFVVISLTGSPPRMPELQALLSHNEMTWRGAITSCGPVFDKAAGLFPERCRYPGTLCVHSTNGCTMETFNSLRDLTSLADQ